MEFQVSKDIANVVATGSRGNCVIYHKTIAVDMGVPFSHIKTYMYNLQIVILSHIHQDHFNLSTLKRLAFERPTLRIGCGEWMAEHLEFARNVDIFKAGEIYDYGSFKISPVKLYHDCETFGFRIYKGDHRTIHITDTCTLEGIEAKNYSLYAIESNYDEETIDQIIEAQKAKGEYSYKAGAANTHLSEQQARDFIYKNRGPHSEVLRLHESMLTA